MPSLKTIVFNNPFSKENIKQAKKYKFIYIMMLPVLLYFIVFSYYPLLLGVIQSLQTDKLIGTPDFAGTQNYMNLFRDLQFWGAFYNSFIIGVGTQVFTISFALIFALGLNEIRNKVFKTTVQTTSYMPFLFSWTVVGGMWVSILSTNGLANGLLKSIGQSPVQFMVERNISQLIMMLTGSWKSIGYVTLLLMAAIISVDVSVYEAAQIDGATRLRQIANITIPELFPTLKIVILLGVMGLLRNFDQVFVMENSMILDKINTLLLYIYTNGITHFQTGLATSAATVVLVATFIITVIVRKIIDYDANY